MNNNKIGYKVHRTTGATVVELVCAALNVVAIGLGVVTMLRHPGAGALVSPLLTAPGVALMLALAYCPSTFNVPDDSPAEAYRLTVQMLRALAVVCSLLSLGLTATLLAGVDPTVCIVGFLLAFVPGLLWYVVRLNRAIRSGGARSSS